MANTKKANLSLKRKNRVRKKVNGTAIRPRLSLKLTNKHIYAQCINDDEGKTLFFLCTNQKDFDGKSIHPNLKGAAEFGEEFGQRAKSIGITQVVFDRGSRRYHGSVAAFAQAARKSISF